MNYFLPVDCSVDHFNGTVKNLKVSIVGLADGVRRRNRELTTNQMSMYPFLSTYLVKTYLSLFLWLSERELNGACPTGGCSWSAIKLFQELLLNLLDSIVDWLRNCLAMLPRVAISLFLPNMCAGERKKQYLPNAFQGFVIVFWWRSTARDIVVGTSYRFPFETESKVCSLK